MVKGLALLSLLAVLTLAGCTSGGSPGESAAAGQHRTTTSEATGAGKDEQACRRDYEPRPLPPWADAGFRPPTLPMPYAMGDKGDIVAILWSEHDPLVVPPAADRSNKILWVARVGSAGPLHIRAELRASGEQVTRTVDGGPGPSIIDLPTAGCWSFNVRWGEQHDHLHLQYAPR